MWTKCQQVTTIFVELEVLFPSFLLTSAPYYRLDRPIMCGKCILYELTKCLDSRLFRFRKHFNVFVKKSVALHTLQNMCQKSSNFENYYALICFLIQHKYDNFERYRNRNGCLYQNGTRSSIIEFAETDIPAHCRYDM